MAIRLRKTEMGALVENWAHDTGIIKMCAALIHIVHYKRIARMNIVPKFIDYGLRGVMQGADMGCNIAAALHDGVAFGVANRRRKITRPDYKRITGSKNLLRHLIDDVDVGIFQYLEGHWIECITVLVRAHYQVLLSFSDTLALAVGRMSVRSALRQWYVDDDG